MGIPVYIFAGFLESGKTKFIKDTLADHGFTDKEKTLLVVCEEGEEEYEEDFLKSVNTVMLEIGSKDEFKGGTLKTASDREKPDRIIIEYNGMWEMKLLDQEFPHDWELYQIITTVNAETYEVYLKNMGPKIIEHVGLSELVVFNRCTPELMDYIRSTNVRAMNPRAYIYLEDTEGNAVDYAENLPLPYDMDADVVEVQDNDFGTLYIDAMNDPQKYEGKTVKFKGQLVKREEYSPERFAAGRFCMTCCVEDINFLAFFCDMKGAEKKIQNDTFAVVTGVMNTQYVPEYQDNVPVLQVTDIVPADKPAEELIYFR